MLSEPIYTAARTIADLEASEDMQSSDLAVAFQEAVLINNVQGTLRADYMRVLS